MPTLLQIETQQLVTTITAPTVLDLSFSPVSVTVLDIQYSPAVVNVLSSGPGGSGSVQVTGETPSGAINGSNASFQSAFDFVPESVEVFISGVRLTLLSDYNTSGNRTITLYVSPLPGELLRINYSINT